MGRFITIKELSAKLGNRSRSAIYIDMKLKRLPPPIKIGGRILWSEDAVEEHMRKMVEAATNQQLNKSTS